MKYINIVLIIVSTMLVLATVTSCKQSSEAGEKMENLDKSGPEYTSAYVCPMHCKESGSAEPGKCPVCSMNYVENKSTGHEAHDHGHDHDHGDHDGHNL